MYAQDNRTVITLDAGGTNFVFSAMRGCEFVIPPFSLKSHPDNLDLCLMALVEGFRKVIDSLDEPPVAISFAFPGPPDYANGIVGGFLPNFPAFQQGVPLGPFVRTLKIPGYEDTVVYDPMKRIGVAISKMGASKAISVGAYAFALSMLDKKRQ